MSVKEIAQVIIASGATVAILILAISVAAFVYYEYIRTRRAEGQPRKKSRRLVGLRLVVEREPEVKDEASF